MNDEDNKESPFKNENDEENDYKIMKTEPE